VEEVEADGSEEGEVYYLVHDEGREERG